MTPSGSWRTLTTQNHKREAELRLVAERLECVSSRGSWQQRIPETSEKLRDADCLFSEGNPRQDSPVRRIERFLLHNRCLGASRSLRDHQPAASAGKQLKRTIYVLFQHFLCQNFQLLQLVSAQSVQQFILSYVWSFPTFMFLLKINSRFQHP